MAENTNTNITNNLIDNNSDILQNKDMLDTKSEVVINKSEENPKNITINHTDNEEIGKNIDINITNNNEILRNVILNSIPDNTIVDAVAKDGNIDNKDKVCDNILITSNVNAEETNILESNLCDEKKEAIINIVLDNVNNENLNNLSKNLKMDNENKKDIVIVDNQNTEKMQKDLENKHILSADNKNCLDMINKEEIINDTNTDHKEDIENTVNENVIDLAEIDLGFIENDEKYKNLLDTIFNLETEKQTLIDESAKKMNSVRKELTVS